MACLFCEIIRGTKPSARVLESETSVAFLDVKPVFLGHVLVVPRTHVVTLGELDASLLAPFFADVQRIARAIEPALDAEGSFVAMNNTISQSVPHLHVHVVPRKKGDGLRGFFWPRHKYESDEAMHAMAAKIRAALDARA